MPYKLPQALCLLLLCLSLTTMPACAAMPAPGGAARAQAALDRIAPHYPGLSATVFVKGREVWSGQAGFADLARQTPVTADTRFNIYSTSKVVTGLAFARLIEDGRVTLDAAAGDIASDLPAALHPVRLEHILSHTSGVRHYRSPQDWLAFAQLDCASTADALAYFQHDPLVHPPDSDEHYSTFAFVLASHLLIRITGEDRFDTAINRLLGSRYQLDSASASKAIAYIRAGQLPVLPAGTSPEDIIPLPFASAECKFGGGGLIASSYQLAETGAALAEGQIIPQAQLAGALTPRSEVSDVVYGAGVRQASHRGRTVTALGASGGAPGGRSYLLVLIEPRIAVALTGNIDGPNLEAAAWEMATAW